MLAIVIAIFFCQYRFGFEIPKELSVLGLKIENMAANKTDVKHKLIRNANAKAPIWNHFKLKKGDDIG
jgi:hypothetical protein